MRVLVTGARGFVGRNLCCALKNIRDGKDRREKYANLLPLEVMEYDVDSTPEELDSYCSRADFVFNLAGVNRPKDQSEFMEGNFGFASTLLETLERHGNRCPVMLSSSAQASLSGRFEGSAYGESKLAGEGLFREYSDRTDAPVLIYRFPNLYGKWCRPRYNSAVATFCDAIANGRSYTVNDPSVELELLYIDDLVDEMLGALLGREHRCGYEGLARVDGDDFCYVPDTDVKSLGEIVYLLGCFRDSRETLSVPDLSEGSFSKKLWSTFLSYYEPGHFAQVCYVEEEVVAYMERRGMPLGSWAHYFLSYTSSALLGVRYNRSLNFAARRDSYASVRGERILRLATERCAVGSLSKVDELRLRLLLDNRYTALDASMLPWKMGSAIKRLARRGVERRI